MFTGIIRGIGKIDSIEERANFRRLRIALPEGAQHDLETGASISVDGVCLTVTAINGRAVDFDVMQETLVRSTLGEFRAGDSVNIERAAKDGAEIGGHPISGHVDCTAHVTKIETPDNNKVLTFQVPAEWMRYIFPKGYVALNGTSLTITNVDKEARTFEVWFIPETLRLTTFGVKKSGDRINLEIERSTQVMVDTVRSFMEERLGSLLPTIESLLAEKGVSLDRSVDVRHLPPDSKKAGNS